VGAGPDAAADAVPQGAGFCIVGYGGTLPFETPALAAHVAIRVLTGWLRHLGLTTDTLFVHITSSDMLVLAETEEHAETLGADMAHAISARPSVTTPAKDRDAAAARAH
jgi:hypothetical protein